MANLELEGRLIQKMPVQSGRSARGEWAKQEFIIEYQEGQFPTKVVMSVWGQDKVAELAKINDGSQVKVGFNLSSREYNGRWYTDIRAWRISPAGQSAPAGGQGYSAGTQGYGNQPAGGYSGPGSAPAYGAAQRSGADMPAGFGPQHPAPSIDDMPGDNADEDLPF